ncbi:MAG: hypothetical protein WB802_07055 [Candidatus Dormiibacterota bacterium]
MTYDTLGMIRRGWQDGVATVAPHVPGLADLVEQRLAEAARLGRLDEAGLLSIVDAATQLAADSGAVDVAPALSKRLRRHVYEYLLSLDAVSDMTPGEPALPPLSRDSGGILIGADEIAAMSPAGLHGTSTPFTGSPFADLNGGAWVPGAASSFAVEGEAGTTLTEVAGGDRGSIPIASPSEDADPMSPDTELDHGPARAALPAFPFGDDDGVSPLAELTGADARFPAASPLVGDDEDPGDTPPASPSAPPQFSFHIGDPDDLLTNRPTPEETGPPPAFRPGASGLDRPDNGDAPRPHRASFSDPSTWPKPVTPSLRGGRETQSELLEHPGPPAPDAGAALPAPDAGRFQDVRPWPVSPPSDPLPRSGFEDLARWSSPWPSAESGTGQGGPGPGPAAGADPGIEDFAPASFQPPGALDEGWQAPADGGWLPAPQRTEPIVPPPEIAAGWSVRQPEAVELHLAPPAGAAPAAPSFAAGDVAEKDLVALRGAVDEKLRKKRCDDAAALLQQAAQELGGQAVAELALDAGDRCRTLGKRNAALNCYLAASRADPVYEPPLARLADICIDDQDIDLAVSYLERIARLTRLRGDTRGALRIFRKIATIAPYRDDVLELLMRAQTTGRLDP